jgi:putative PIN family toxin of toxin-antitoxin system
MMKTPERVVFDCNVYFQAFISEGGPAGRLLQAVHDGRLVLFLSQFVLDELKDVLARPHIVQRFKFTENRVEEFLGSLTELGVVEADVPHVFEYPRDPKDAHYVDLAIAARAKLIVSRDKDLLSLRDASTVEGRDFAARFPSLQILTPTDALQLIDADADVP